ncbi:DEAD/DEAH box helicase family protein [Halomonas korlensis]|uniref:Helicase C-terminal domain-containing protein n=1 Tax=Halomonas korlensis TaxID=463301 RepID=A0A1I7J3P2_9GAMM|nr:DEAD/DEAH box helicase family protein [Halomonas korlensis]SFU79784.1 Helicase C-terminal domain-containing protein [Halomonas korlensis]
MIDFSKLTGSSSTTALTDPSLIYENSDRETDKGPLRPAQEYVLTDWHTNRRSDKDVLVKLHTGQGKTLVGLLMLQSKLNETGNPSLYVCPNNYLVGQTLKQAKSFGISCIEFTSDLPVEFENGESILVCNASKAFNGFSKLGTRRSKVENINIVIDDSHACSETIKNACIITLKNGEDAYRDIISLFEEDLEGQGEGTLREIKDGGRDALLPVPYWAWYENTGKVADILSKNLNSNDVKFAWEIIKDALSNCQCLVSGKEVSIVPYTTPIRNFDFYESAGQRVFMSATMVDDSFLIADLGISIQSVQKPLVYPDEKWSGEKMVLIPSEIDSEVNLSTLGELFCQDKESNSIGTSILVSSEPNSRMWTQYGAIYVSKDNIDAEVAKLHNEEERYKARVFANKYDGIDLPDSACRVLVLSGNPYSNDLSSQYENTVRVGSDVVEKRLARSIEQGMGRSVRGDKDYSVIVLIGPDLVKQARSKKTRRHFSPQTNKQVDIGLKIVSLAKGELEHGGDIKDVLKSLINKCLSRDSAWKDFYRQEMNSIKSTHASSEFLGLFMAERQADEAYRNGDYSTAAQVMQSALDKEELSQKEKAWYLQEMARLVYPYSKTESNKFQLAAFSSNRLLLKPRDGIKYDKISYIPEARVSRVISWVNGFDEPQEMVIEIDEILSNLRFEGDSKRFERAWDSLGKSLGFTTQMPDSEWKMGPDNLWVVTDGTYLLVEAKNEVKKTRSEIVKSEAEQIDSSIAWFKEQYPGANSVNVLIIPARKFARGVAVNNPIKILDDSRLRAFKKQIRRFFVDLSRVKPDQLSEDGVAARLQEYELCEQDILDKYLIGMMR